MPVFQMHMRGAVLRLQKEKTSKMGELQQKALSRVEDKMNLNKMSLKEFRKGQPLVSLGWCGALPLFGPLGPVGPIQAGWIWPSSFES